MTALRHRPPRILCLLAAAAILAAAPVAAAPNELPEKQLEELRERISRLEARIRRDSERKAEHQAALRRAEKSAAAAAAALEQTRRAGEAGRRRLDDLRARRGKLESELARDAEALAGEVRAAWLADREPRLKLVLSQQDPASLGRMLAWYGYLARDRAGRIGAARDRLAELAALSAEVEAENERLAALEARRREELRAQEAAREARARAVAAADAALAESGAEARRLKEEAEVLEKLVEELRAAVVDLPVPEAGPFAGQRGRLAWPVAGTLARDFGERKGSGPKSSGVLIGVDRGAEVRAVWTGRVAYADWLPGLGLLLIVDHGDGYLSLYGHNEVLFKAVGDWVATGEVIARAGDTGGRDQAGLYFEIRKGREPQNPHRWFAGKLARGR